MTTEALSAVPVPLRTERPEPVVAGPDPARHPGAAARALPAASGGEAAEPDLAEIPARAVASMRAAWFDIALPHKKKRTG